MTAGTSTSDITWTAISDAGIDTDLVELDEFQGVYVFADEEKKIVFGAAENPDTAEAGGVGYDGHAYERDALAGDGGDLDGYVWAISEQVWFATAAEMVGWVAARAGT